MNQFLGPLICLFLFIVHLQADQHDKDIKTSLWIDLYHGEVISYEDLIYDLSQARVIYLGETHRIRRHHQWQLKILQALQDKGHQLILGLEQIESSYQKQVEQYNKGKDTFERFATNIDWEKRWHNYIDYQDLVIYAQQKSIPIIALNAKAEIIRKIGRQGLHTLPKAERNQLPKTINWEDDPIYREWLDKILLVHMPLNPEKLPLYFQAQVARDENMAEQLVKALKDKGDDAKAVVITGSGHVNYGLGMPQRVTRWLGEHKKRIILFSDSGELKLTYEEKAIAREIAITHDDLNFIKSPIANYLLATEIKKE
ncbi:MAG: ChaN family lipoprotein [Verrucomicrobiota bacterium]